MFYNIYLYCASILLLFDNNIFFIVKQLLYTSYLLLIKYYYMLYCYKQPTCFLSLWDCQIFVNFIACIILILNYEFNLGYQWCFAFLCFRDTYLVKHLLEIGFGKFCDPFKYHSRISSLIIIPFGTIVFPKW